MNNQTMYVLIHSPLVGGLTWTLVADQMRQREANVQVPILKEAPNSTEPFWKQHAYSVLSSLTDISQDMQLIFVAHSGAGPLLPSIGQLIPNSVQAYVFVDAGIPRNGATRLDLMKSEDADWANEFQAYLQGGGRFPTWSMDELQDVIPDHELRRQLVAQLNPRGLDFFSEPIPVFDGWPDAPPIYIQFSESYDWDAAQAHQAGWPTYQLQGGHFHMLVEPKEVTQLILDAVNKIA